VQAKKYKETVKVDVKPIRELKGLLHRDEHIGIFITSSYFTKDAEAFARQSDIHIKLINRDELIDLWQEYYSKLTETEKLFLPLRPIYFLGGGD
jgi:restriction system protein